MKIMKIIIFGTYVEDTVLKRTQLIKTNKEKSKNKE